MGFFLKDKTSDGESHKIFFRRFPEPRRLDVGAAFFSDFGPHCTINVRTNLVDKVFNDLAHLIRNRQCQKACLTVSKAMVQMIRHR